MRLVVCEVSRLSECFVPAIRLENTVNVLFVERIERKRRDDFVYRRLAIIASYRVAYSAPHWDDRCFEPVVRPSFPQSTHNTVVYGGTKVSIHLHSARWYLSSSQLVWCFPVGQFSRLRWTTRRAVLAKRLRRQSRACHSSVTRRCRQWWRHDNNTSNWSTRKHSRFVAIACRHSPFRTIHKQQQNLTAAVCLYIQGRPCTRHLTGRQGYANIEWNLHLRNIFSHKLFWFKVNNLLLVSMKSDQDSLKHIHSKK